MRVIPPVATSDGSATLAAGSYVDKFGVTQTSTAGQIRLSYDPANLSTCPKVLYDVATDSVGVGLVSASTLTENDTDDAPLWYAATNYAIGNRVRRPNHKIYENLTAGADAATPESYVESGTSTPRWFEVEPTNKYAPFDLTFDTQAQGQQAYAYLLTPGTICTDLDLFNLDCAQVRVQVFAPGEGEVYNRLTDLRTRNCRSWTDWFTKPIVRRRGLALSDLPYFRKAVVAVTFFQPGGVAKVGDIVLGRGQTIGEMQNRPSVRVVDYSSNETNKWGVTRFSKGKNANVIDCDLRVENVDFDEFNRLMRIYKSQPLAYIGSEEYDSLQFIGFSQEHSAILDVTDGSIINLQVQGLVQT